MEYWIRDTGYGILDMGYGILDTEYWIRDVVSAGALPPHEGNALRLMGFDKPDITMQEAGYGIR